MGSGNEAEDIVQEAWLRWQNYDRNTVVDPPAFLPRRPHACVSTLCSRRVRRRETYIGPWLPEPVVGAIRPGRQVPRINRSGDDVVTEELYTTVYVDAAC